MPPWLPTQAIPHLCRRCQIWAGRKPGFNVQLPCRARGHWQFARSQSTHDNSNSRRIRSDDDFADFEVDAIYSRQNHNGTAPVPGSRQVVFDAEEFARFAEDSSIKNTQKSWEPDQNLSGDDAFASEAFEQAQRGGRDALGTDDYAYENLGLAEPTEIYRPAEAGSFVELSESSQQPSNRNNLWWKPPYKLNLDLKQRPKFEFTPTEYSQPRKSSTTVSEDPSEIPDVYVSTNATPWPSNILKLSDVWRPESRGKDSKQTEHAFKEELLAKGLDPQAKLQTFNFCAHFRELPSVDYTITPSPGINVVCVRLSSVNIVGYASDRDLGIAEIKAFMDFKRAATEWWSKKMTTPLVLQGIDEVNLDNASLLLKYYKSLQDRDLRPTEPVKVGGHKWMTAGGWLRKLSPPGSYTRESETRQLATLVAAIELLRDDPAIFTQWREETQYTSGIAPAPVETITTELSKKAEIGLLDAPRILRDVKKFRGIPFKFLTSAVETENAADQFLLLEYELRNNAYQGDEMRKNRNESLRRRQEVIDERRNESEAIDRLPIEAKRAETLTLIRENRQVVVTGGTGSGKSTQVPQFIFEEAASRGNGADCNVICAQPRRVAAVSLAARLCQERQEEVGEVVGYIISGDRNVAASGGSITFCTTDVLALQLERNPEKVLPSISHIIVDEVHILDQSQVKLLATLKSVFERYAALGRVAPKLILMSATLSPLRLNKIRSYLQPDVDANESSLMPVIDVPGRGFTVTKAYLEDVMDDIERNIPEETLKKINLSSSRIATARSALAKLATINDGSQTTGWCLTADRLASGQDASTTQITARDGSPLIQWESQREQWERESQAVPIESLAVAKILEICRTTEDGAILVFLPGWSYIELAELLLQQARAGAADLELPPLEILKMHSRYPEGLQQAQEPATPGIRRIMLSTDVAETSLTFKDVRFVIDSGTNRADKSQDQNRRDIWVEEVGRSSMLQRAGRAGRVQEGFYFSLVSKGVVERQHHDDPLSNFISKGDIQLFCLRARLNFPQMSIKEYFNSWLAPPPPRLIEAAIEELITKHKALNASQELTEYGGVIAQLAVSPADAKAILLGLAMQCLTPALVISCSDDQSSICEDIELSRAVAGGTDSDHVLQVKAYLHMEAILLERGLEGAQHYAAQHGLNIANFQALQLKVKRLMKRLRHAGYLVQDRVVPLYLDIRANDDVTIKIIAFMARSSNLAAHKKDLTFRTQQGSNAVLGRQSMLTPDSWVPSSKGANPLEATMACYDNLISLSEKSSLPFMSGVSPVSPIMAILLADNVELTEDTADAETTPEDVPAFEEGSRDTLSTFMINGFIPLRIATSDSSARKAARRLMTIRSYWQNMAHLCLQGMTIRRQPGKSRVYGRKSQRMIMAQLIADLVNLEIRGVRGPGALKGNNRHLVLDYTSEEEKAMRRRLREEEAEARKQEQLARLVSRSKDEEDWPPVQELDEATIGDSEVVDESGSSTAALEGFQDEPLGEGYESFAQNLFLDDFVVEDDFEAYEDFDDSRAPVNLLLLEIETTLAQAVLADSVRATNLCELQTNARWEAKMAKRARKVLAISEEDVAEGEEEEDDTEEMEEESKEEMERRMAIEEERLWRLRKTGEMNLEAILQAQERKQRLKAEREAGSRQASELR